MFKEFHYRWEWRLKSSPEALWPFVADTDRFTRDTGVPSVEDRMQRGERAPNARRRLRLYRFGVRIEWEEEPFEWVRPYRFGVMRRYTTGPVATMRTFIEFKPDPQGGTHLTYDVWARPANVLGLVAIPAQIGVLSTSSFDRAMREYDRLAQARTDQPAPDPFVRPRFAPGGEERLAALRGTLLERGARADLVNLLVYTLTYTEDMALSRLRPYALADRWEMPRREVLELCLWATRVGLLEFSWDVLCPLCRGAKDSSATLGDLPSRVHCDTCNVDYAANFERSVELTFRPNPAIRRLDEREFCVGGPQLTPHIVAQQFLPPGDRRALSLPLEPGRYRLRALELRGAQALAARPGGDSEFVIRARSEGWTNDEPGLSLHPTLQLENETAGEQLLILERTAWSDQAVTAAEVTTLQLFRDLFANEALRPGERISVGSLTIVFTDLRDSSRLYREVGDAVAFGWVMDHYDVLRENILAEGGAIVKTIGDAVMAVFVHPINALRAILRAQHELAHPPAGKTPLSLKAGLHYGPCIAVRLNDRLDYFGSTVNFAARLETHSPSGGIILSPAVRNDPEVAGYMSAVSGLVAIESFEASLKGFDEECVELWRVSLE
jgi:class 3 adenylate cyclase